MKSFLASRFRDCLFETNERKIYQHVDGNYLTYLEFQQLHNERTGSQWYNKIVGDYILARDYFEKKGYKEKNLEED